MGSPSAQVVRTSTGARRMRDLSVTSFQAMEILWSNLLKLPKSKDPCKTLFQSKDQTLSTASASFLGNVEKEGES